MSFCCFKRADSSSGVSATCVLTSSGRCRASLGLFSSFLVDVESLFQLALGGSLWPAFLAFLGAFLSSCDEDLFLFVDRFLSSVWLLFSGGCFLSSVWLLFSGGISLRNASFLFLKPHRFTVIAAFTTLFFVSFESRVTLMIGSWSLLRDRLTGRAPIIWYCLISMPSSPIFSCLSFRKSWYSA